MKKILAKILERMGNWFNSPNPLFEFDIYKQGNKLLLFISFLRFGKVLTLCYPEEKDDIHSGVLREWEDELCPYDFPTKEEKESAQSLSKVENQLKDWTLYLNEGDKVVWTAEGYPWAFKGDVFTVNSIGEFQMRDGEWEPVERWVEEIAPYKEPNSYEGIYLSKVSERMFEATLSDNGEYYFINYCDDLPNDIETIRVGVFKIHVEVMEYYQQVFSYLEIERGIE